MKHMHAYKHPVEFKVSREKNWKETIEQIMVTFNDTSYTEKVNKFTNFIQSIKDSIKRFFLETPDMPIEIYDRFTRFSSDDYQQLFQAYANQNADLYFLVLKNKSFKALHYYITKVFFLDYTVKDASVWIDQLKQKYPLVSNSHFYKLDNKKFKDQCVQSIIDDIDQELWTAAGEVLNILQQQSPENGVYTNMLYTLLQTILIWCSSGFLKTKFAESRRENAHNSLREIQERKEKINTIEREKNKQKHSQEDVSSEQSKEDLKVESWEREKKDEFDKIFLSFSESSHYKLQKILNQIRLYVRRMYKNNAIVHMKTIQESLWTLFDQEVITFVRSLCTDLDLSIKELEDVSEDIKNILSQSVTNRIDQPVSETIQSVLIKSKTLESIKDNPEKLTTAILIDICKELWYRFWDEKEFSSYSNELWLEKEWKRCFAIKKKLIDYLGKAEKDTRLIDWWRKTKTYEKLTFNDASRMVKQKNTILRLTDHDTYDDLVNLHFRKHKRDFDDKMSTMQKEGDIDWSYI